MEDKFSVFTIRDIVILHNLLVENNGIMSVENKELRWFALRKAALTRLASSVKDDQVYT